MPLALKFLHPYIRSLVNPPRHAIVYAATKGDSFLAALNSNVLECCRARCHYATLISQWASTVTEALSGLLDDASRSRGQNRAITQENIILRFLPVFNSGFSKQSAPELKSACCMILTLLIHKADLSETLLDSLMQAVVNGCDVRSEETLTVLALLAVKKETPRLPSEVLRALLEISDFPMLLRKLKAQGLVDRLAIALTISLLDNHKGKLLPKEQTFISDLLLSNLLEESSILMITGLVLQQHRSQSPLEPGEQWMTSIIHALSGLENIRSAIDALSDQYSINTVGVHKSLRDVATDEGGSMDSSQSHLDTNTSAQSGSQDLDFALTRPAFQDVTTETFLSEPAPSIFNDLVKVFASSRISPEDLDKFSRLPILCRELAFERPTYFSFFIRIWCGPYPDSACMNALRMARDVIEAYPNSINPQTILPYIIYGLSQTSQQVRRLSREVALAIAARESSPDSVPQANVPIIGGGTGDLEEHALCKAPAVKLVDTLLIPYLEEAELDQNAIVQAIVEALNGFSKMQTKEASSRKLPSKLRTGLFSLFCRQVPFIPLIAVQVTLLKIVSNIHKSARESKMEVLSALLARGSGDAGEANIIARCMEQNYKPNTYFKQLLEIVEPRDKDAVSLLLRHLASTDSKKSPLFYPAVARRIEDMWSSASDEVQIAIASHLLGSTLKGLENTASVEKEGNALIDLRSLSLTSKTLLTLLAGVPRLFPSIQQSSHAPKRRRTNHSQHIPAFLPPRDHLDHLTIVLESLESSDSAKDPDLLNVLFPIITDLQKCANYHASSVAYLQILALKAALRITWSIERSAEQDFDRSVIHIDVLVDCIRSTSNVQVQQAALLLTSSLATIAPELVLHGVMPVFTFMGSSFIRNDDEYSAHVVSKTIDSVVPRLVQSLGKGAGDPLSKISPLLISFVATYKHVPAQRRRDFFSSIADRIGAEQYLYALLTILVDKYPDDEDVFVFASDLAGSQSMQTQTLIVSRLLAVVTDVLQPKPVISRQLLVDTNSPHSGLQLLRLVGQIIERADFIIAIARGMAENAPEGETLQAAYRGWVEQVLIIKKLVPSESEVRPLIEGMFGSINGLLSLSQFATTMPELLNKVEPSFRTQILASFERRLKSTTRVPKETQTVCLELLPDLGELLLTASTNLNVSNAAISCIGQIIDKFGKKDEAAVIAAAKVIAQFLDHDDYKIRSSSSLCLATCIGVVGEGFIPLLASTVPNILQSLHSSCAEETEDARLHNAGFSFMTALLLYIPFMLSQDQLDQLLKASHESSFAGLGSAADKTRSSCQELIAMQIDLPQCLRSLERTWSSAVSAGPGALQEHLEILHKAIERHKKTDIGKQVDPLGSLFLKMLDLRRIQFSPRTEDSYDDDEVEAVEEAVIDCMMATIYKLNDNLFRPLFSTLVAWPDSSNSDQSAMLRKISLYKFLHVFFNTLKSIVTSYSSLILPPTLATLVHLSTSLTLNHEAQALWHHIFETLNACFTHDQDELFLSLPAPPIPAPTATPLEPLTSPPLLAPTLLTFIPHLATTFSSSSSSPNPSSPTNLYIRTLVSYATTTEGSPPHHRHLNLSLLAFLRASNTYALSSSSSSPFSLSEKAAAKCRVLAIQLQRAITDKLGEQWLGINLAEILPVMREALDDEDEDVLDEAEGWKADVAAVTGEDVGEMLT